MSQEFRIRFQEKSFLPNTASKDSVTSSAQSDSEGELREIDQRISRRRFARSDLYSSFRILSVAAKKVYTPPATARIAIRPLKSTVALAA